MTDTKPYEDPDLHYKTIESVRELESDFDVRMDDGWSLLIEGKYGVAPREGDRIGVWGKIGLPIRGISINDTILFYRTPEEEKARHDKEVAERKVKMRKEWERSKPDFDATVERLPPLLRDRVLVLRQSEKFWEFEAYELSCCEDAAKLFEYVNGDLEKLEEMHKLGPESEVGKSLGLFDGHSGNSWGFACLLTRLMIQHPDLVSKYHGALCNLVGCEGYGCPVDQAKLKEESNV